MIGEREPTTAISLMNGQGVARVLNGQTVALAGGSFRAPCWAVVGSPWRTIPGVQTGVAFRESTLPLANATVWNGSATPTYAVKPRFLFLRVHRVLGDVPRGAMPMGRCCSCPRP